MCSKIWNIKNNLIILGLCISKKGEDGLESQIGKHRDPNKGRPKGTYKPRNRIEELERETFNSRFKLND